MKNPHYSRSKMFALSKSIRINRNTGSLRPIAPLIMNRHELPILSICRVFFCDSAHGIRCNHIGDPAIQFGAVNFLPKCNYSRSITGRNMCTRDTIEQRKAIEEYSNWICATVFAVGSDGVPNIFRKRSRNLKLIPKSTEFIIDRGRIWMS